MGIVQMQLIIKPEVTVVQTQREEFKRVKVVGWGENLVSKVLIVQA